MGGTDLRENSQGGYGSFRVVKYLNNNGVRTHSGAKFQSNTIIRILRNKLFCGYIVSGEVVSPHMKELQIIDKELFEQAQYILDQRSSRNEDKRQIAMTTKSQALLSGIMFCSHCGGRLTSNVYHDTYMRSDGTFKTGEYLRYICYHKSRKLCQCDGQSTYAAKKVDEAVCNAIMDIFGRITDAPDEMVLQKKYKKEIASCKARETKLNMELQKYTAQLDKLNDEIANSLTGDSVYSPEQLSAAITGINKKITDAKEQLETIKNEMSSKKVSMEKIKPAYERFTGWADEFVAATTERKKMIISQVVSRIEISKGYKINLVLSSDYERFCEGWDVLHIDTNV